MVMFLEERLLTRGRLPISSFLCFIVGFSMGSWLTLFHQLQLEKDLSQSQEDFALLSQQEPSLLLATLIISAPNNFDRRNTLRTTWLRLKAGGGGSSVKHFFLVGTEGLDADVMFKLRRENSLEEDLLFLPDLTDSYNNLTLKVSRGLEELSALHPFKYLLKCDDDSFVRIDLVTAHLRQRDRDEKAINIFNTKVGPGGDSGKCFYWGFFDGRARVQKKGKWKEEEYNLCDLYIPYALGGGYVLSRGCVDYIVRNHGALKLFRNEDVSVGTWLAPIVHEKMHDALFDTEFESRGCNNKHLVQHKISQAEMVERYKHLMATGKLCPREFRKRPAYSYQWNLPPSQCCQRNSTNEA